MFPLPRRTDLSPAVLGALRPVLFLAVGVGAVVAAPLVEREAPAQEGCTADQSTSAALSLRFTTLTVLWSQLNEDRFTAERDAFKAQVTCLREPLVPHDVAELHMWMAFYQGTRGGALGLDQAEQSFRAALASSPGFSKPVVLLPAGHPLLARFEAAKRDPASRRAGFKAQGRVVYVDGVLASDRPTEVPTFVQVADASGVVQGSIYLGVNERMPDLKQYGSDAPVVEEDKHGRKATEREDPPHGKPPDPLPPRPTPETNEHTFQFGVAVGDGTDVHVGLRPPGWNQNGGFGLDEVGVQLVAMLGFGSGDPAFIAAFSPYTDWDLSTSWQLRVGLGVGIGASGSPEGDFVLAAQWDPPERHVEVNLGAAGIVGDEPGIAPDLSIGWSW